VIPYDAACTLVAIEQETGRLSYALGDYFFGRVKAVEDFLNRHGAIVGRPERVEELLEDDNLVLVFPGGARDMVRKFWRDPYRVVDHKGFAEGRGGYIKIALRRRAPIVPLAVIGAEETHVLLHDSPSIARIIGVPFFPFLAFPFPLPVKLYVRFGEPIHLEPGPEAADDQEIVDELNRNVRWQLQELIDDTRRSRKGVFLSRYENGSGSDSR
jgi:1-acyl-sn-glycerol-3-phosphate acyltransferase